MRRRPQPGELPARQQLQQHGRRRPRRLLVAAAPLPGSGPADEQQHQPRQRRLVRPLCGRRRGRLRAAPGAAARDAAVNGDGATPRRDQLRVPEAERDGGGGGVVSMRQRCVVGLRDGGTSRSPGAHSSVGHPPPSSCPPLLASLLLFFSSAQPVMSPRSSPQHVRRRADSTGRLRGARGGEHQKEVPMREFCFSSRTTSSMPNDAQLRFRVYRTFHLPTNHSVYLFNQFSHHGVLCRAAIFLFGSSRHPEAPSMGIPKRIGVRQRNFTIRKDRHHHLVPASVASSYLSLHI